MKESAADMRVIINRFLPAHFCIKKNLTFQILLRIRPLQVSLAAPLESGKGTMKVELSKQNNYGLSVYFVTFKFEKYKINENG